MKFNQNVDKTTSTAVMVNDVMQYEKCKNKRVRFRIETNVRGKKIRMYIILKSKIVRIHTFDENDGVINHTVKEK